MKKIVLGFVVVLALWVSAGEVNAAQLITNGGFETGDFSSWNVGIVPSYSEGGRPFSIDTTGDGWVVSKSMVGSVPPITNYSAMNGFDGGVLDSSNKPVYEADLVFFLSQSFNLSSMSNSTILSFDFRTYGAQSTSYESSRGTPIEQRIFSVSFLNASNVNIGTVYSYGLPYNSFILHDLNHVEVDVTSLLNSVGQSGTYTILFNELVPQYFTGGAGIAIDNINLSADFNGNSLTPSTSVPEPAAMLLLGLGLMGLAGARRKFKK